MIIAALAVLLSLYSIKRSQSDASKNSDIEIAIMKSDFTALHASERLAKLELDVATLRERIDNMNMLLSKLERILQEIKEL